MNNELPSPSDWSSLSGVRNTRLEAFIFDSTARVTREKGEGDSEQSDHLIFKGALTFDPEKSDEELSELIQHAANFDGEGHIKTVEGLAVASLEINLPDSPVSVPHLDLKDFKLILGAATVAESTNLDRNSGVNVSPSDEKPVDWIELKAKLKLDDSPQPIILSGVFEPSAATFSLTADLDFGIGELSTLVSKLTGLQPSAGQLPGELPLFCDIKEQLKLRQLTLDVSRVKEPNSPPNEGKTSQVDSQPANSGYAFKGYSFTLDTRKNGGQDSIKDWDPFKGLVFEDLIPIPLRRVQFFLSVENPKDEKTRRSEVKLSGYLNLDNDDTNPIPLVVNAEMSPRLRLSIGLAPGAKVSLADLVAKYLPPLKGLLPGSLDCKGFDLLAEPGEKPKDSGPVDTTGEDSRAQFNLFAIFDGEWGDGKFGINDFFINFRAIGPKNDPGTKSEQTEYSGGIGGTIRISKNDNDSSPIEFDVSAAYEASQSSPGSDEPASQTEGGWLFKGEADEIKLGDLIEALKFQFGIGNTAFPTIFDPNVLALRNLSIEYDTAPDGKISFGCELAIGSDSAEGEESEETSDDDLVIAIRIDLTKETKEQPEDKADPSTNGDQKKSYKPSFSGTIQITDVTFELQFKEADEEATDTTGAPKSIVATYTDKDSRTLSLHTLIGAVSEDAAELIPEVLDIGIKEVLFVYSIPPATKSTGTEEEQQAIADTSPDKKKFLMRLTLSGDVDLKDIPLAGNALPGRDFVFDRLNFTFASVNFNTGEVNGFNDLLPDGLSSLPLPEENDGANPDNNTDSAIKKGLQIRVHVKLDDWEKEISLIPNGPEPSTDKPTPQPEETAQPPAIKVRETDAADLGPPSSASPVVWMKVDRSLGPVGLKRVGVAFDGKRLWFYVGASLQAGPLSLTLDGLGVGSPVNEFDPKFSLDGLGVDFKNGPVELSGAFLKDPNPPENVATQFSGFAQLKTATYNLEALGSYAEMESGDISFFVFAMLDKPLGGPAFFYITGLAAGFGYNRTLVMPPIEGVSEFPLVKGALDDGFLDKNDLSGTFEKLNHSIPPEDGALWFGIGIRFRTFGLIDSFALISAVFGTELQFSLLGISRMTIPELPEGVDREDFRPLVFAELQIKAVIRPESGFVGVEAMLTPNSYVLMEQCRMTGGFAFYSWYDGPNEGDFVISLGGYHPSFQIPSHYPRPAPVSYNAWQPPELSIKGSCYFAMTPSMLMAGGRLQIEYRLPGIKAWFDAYANFLVQWKPLVYEATMGVSIGVRLSVKVGPIRVSGSFSVGVRLTLHGPPLGGKARVKIGIVKFTIHFGRGRPEAKPLCWDQFKATMLPAGSVVTAPIENGLLNVVRIPGSNQVKANAIQTPLQKTTATSEANLSTETVYRIINPHRFSVIIQSPVPSYVYKFRTAEDEPKDPAESKPAFPQTLGIRPMGKTIAKSCLSISFYHNGDASNDAKAGQFLAQYIDIEEIRKGVPEAVWSKNNLDPNGPPNSNVISNTLVGLRVKTKAGPRPHQTVPFQLRSFAYQSLPKWVSFVPARSPSGASQQSSDTTPIETIKNSLSSDDIRETRDALITYLEEQEFLAPATREHASKPPPDFPEQQSLDDLLGLLRAAPSLANVGSPWKPNSQ